MPRRSERLFRQRTISCPTSISGLGIHTGNCVHLTLQPAAENTGIRFRRLDCGGAEIPALVSDVSSLELATTLGFGGATVSTIEHLMAAVRLMNVDNLVIELDGPEVPILDGSALPYLRLLQAAGLRAQDAWRRIAVITHPIEATVGDKRIRVSPFEGLRISYRIDFASPRIGRQTLDLVVDLESFERELAPARTFALWSDVQGMRERGLALGGTSENCVVFDDGGPINTELRFPDEPVRHKALDAIGDLALLGSPIWGHVEVDRGGHLLHYLLLETMREQPWSWHWMSADDRVWSEMAREAPASSFAGQALQS